MRVLRQFVALGAMVTMGIAPIKVLDHQINRHTLESVAHHEAQGYSRWKHNSSVILGLQAAAAQEEPHPVVK